MLENIVYDVTREPASGGLMLLAFFGLLGLFIGGGALLASRAGASSKARANVVACIGVFFFAVAVFFVVSGLSDRQTCVDAVRAGEFRTTVGLLSSLTRNGTKPPYEYSFNLGEERFVSGPAIVGVCGLAPSPSSRFRFLDGQHLRIDHQGNRILRVILLTAPDPGAKETKGQD